mgnify:CR=1 FL=1
MVSKVILAFFLYVNMLKLLIKMQHTHVKERSELLQQMQKAGYQKEEIFYVWVNQ